MLPFLAASYALHAVSLGVGWGQRERILGAAVYVLLTESAYDHTPLTLLSIDKKLEA